MPAIARKTAGNIVRSLVGNLALLCIAAACACADTHDDVVEVITSMAGALTEATGNGASVARGNVSKFMDAVSKDMPDYDRLKSDVTALVNEGEVSSSILPLSEEGDDQMYKIDLDWLLEVRSLEQDGPLLRRREVIHCELRKEKKRWKIVALKPLEFFAPADLGK